MNEKLKEYLDAKKTLVECALDAGLPLERDEPSRVHAAMRYATLRGGKRIRPIFALAVAEMADLPAERVLRPACAIELVHAASLILDDLPCMDNAESRRGAASTHVAFGEATSLLAVMGLLALAFEFASEAGVAKILSEAMGTRGLVLGQEMDLAQTGCVCDSLKIIEDVHHYKAGALFLACVKIPVVLAEMAREDADALETYARNVGFAFQIADDLMDARSGSEDLGKNTFVSLMGREEAERKAGALVDEAIEALRRFGDKAEPLRALAAYVTTRAE
jgi:geranylgeranyl diphosphate synthase type II